MAGRWVGELKVDGVKGLAVIGNHVQGPGLAHALAFVIDNHAGKRLAALEADVFEHGTSPSFNDFGYTLHYAYNENGSLTRTKVTHGAKVTYDQAYSHDVLGRLDYVHPTGTPKTSYIAYGYDDFGRLNTVRYPLSTVDGPGTTTTYNYDDQHRLTDMSVGPATGTPLATFNYNDATAGKLSKTGRRKSAVERVNNVDRTVKYEYDNLSRLTKEDITQGTPSGTISYGSTGQPGYDNVGNRKLRSVAPNGAIPGLEAQSCAYDLRGRLTSDTYDNNGNTQIGSVLSGGVVPNVADLYDFENRLTQRKNTGTPVTTVTIKYDGDGSRVYKEVERGSALTKTWFVVDDRNPTGYGQVLEEWTKIDSSPVKISKRYLYGHDLISQDINISTTDSEVYDTFYYGYDGHGSVRFLLDSSGTITDTYTYDAFGVLLTETHSTTPATANVYLYCGEQYDPDLGLYYNRARYLNPGTGRFWTMDTFEGHLSDPLSLHRYLYANADPVSHVDPSGNDAELKSTLAAVANIANMAKFYIGSIPGAARVAFGTGGAAIGRFFNQFAGEIQTFGDRIIRLGG